MRLDCGCAAWRCVRVARMSRSRRHVELEIRRRRCERWNWHRRLRGRRISRQRRRDERQRSRRELAGFGQRRNAGLQHGVRFGVRELSGWRLRLHATAGSLRVELRRHDRRSNELRRVRNSMYERQGVQHGCLHVSRQHRSLWEHLCHARLAVELQDQRPAVLLVLWQLHPRQRHLHQQRLHELQAVSHGHYGLRQHQSTCLRRREHRPDELRRLRRQVPRRRAVREGKLRTLPARILVHRLSLRPAMHGARGARPSLL
jgi:hypothetical protein